MNDDEALSAIESLDGQDFDGRRLTVNEARPRTPGGGGGGERVAVIAAAGGGEGGWLSRRWRLSRRRVRRRLLTATQSCLTASGAASEEEASCTERASRLALKPCSKSRFAPISEPTAETWSWSGSTRTTSFRCGLTGACQGCSSSIMTLTMRVEATLKAHVPEIRFVEAVP